MLTVAETTVASVFSTVKIWRVSCTKEFHAQGPFVRVSLSLGGGRISSSSPSIKRRSISQTSSHYLSLCIIFTMHTPLYHRHHRHLTIVISTPFHFPDIIGFQVYPTLFLSVQHTFLLHASTHHSFYRTLLFISLAIYEFSLLLSQHCSTSLGLGLFFLFNSPFFFIGLSKYVTTICLFFPLFCSGVICFRCIVSIL